LPDYELPLAGSENVRVATALAGLVGTLVVFGFGWGLARVFSAAGGSRAARMAADAT
jgi:cobalt/nickel transport system permease protein